jgi:hypothetical protein
MPNSSGSSGSEEEDISAVEYARLNGLARNYLTDKTHSTVLGGLQGTLDNGLVCDTHLQQLKIPVDCNTCERLSISKDGAQWLSWVMHPEPYEAIDVIGSFILESLEFKRTRLELPLLNSDHESDVMGFATRDTFELQLKDVRLPLEVLDIERNECLNFSTGLWNLGTEILEELKREKLLVTRESLQYIRSAIRWYWDDVDEEELRGNKKNYARVSIHRRVEMTRLTDPISAEYCPWPSHTSTFTNVSSRGAV